jgi:molecular chaperone HscB
MRLDADDFELLGLPKQFALNAADLHGRWQAALGQAHPDRFASEGAAAQRLAVQWSTRINEAYQRLKDPLRRASYLCDLAGVPVSGPGAKPLSGAFLVQQMQWREQMDEASGRADLDALDAVTSAVQTDLMRDLTDCLDDRGDMAAASTIVARLLFIGKFRRDLLARLDDEVSA